MKNLWKNFATPPLASKSRPFWFWNSEAKDMSDNVICTIMEKSVKESGYAGFAIIPSKTSDYLSEDYFARYETALKKALELGLKMCLYDENGFPSGAANGRFGMLYPADTVKRLDKLEWNITGPQYFSEAFEFEGTLMGAVAMNVGTKERVDITDNVRYTPHKCIDYSVPAGEWKIMVFVCVTEGSPIVDYLSKESVDKFIEMTHQAYYNRLGQYFGSVIDSAFYDEPAMWGFEGPWIPGGKIVTEGRMWTPDFNKKYEQEYNQNPVLYYPALWSDIGEETSIARYRLMKLRTDLFGTQYVKNMADWCEDHELNLTGHMWEENFGNPTGAMGDLMKVFKYQQIPGIDSIFDYQCVRRALKIVSSSAYNWDKTLVMCETYGGMKEDEALRRILFKEAMDQYAKGVNYMVPHAIWYTEWAGISPEISYRSQYALELPQYNNYIGRLNFLLQGGRHVADIAVLYPVSDLQAAFSFSNPGDLCEPSYTNYMDIGELLSSDIRRDFTYLHPEVLEEKCTIDSDRNTLNLNNPINYEEYRVLIIPAMSVINAANMRKIREFYNKGGKIIAIGKLPSRALEYGQDQDVRDIVYEVFGVDPEQTYSESENSNKNGGKAWFITKGGRKELKTRLDKALDVYDVDFEGIQELKEGTLTYIHKLKEGSDIYFIANSSSDFVGTYINLRGKFDISIGDPHTGERITPQFTHSKKDGMDVTRVKLELQPERSLFIVGGRCQQPHNS